MQSIELDIWPGADRIRQDFGAIGHLAGGLDSQRDGDGVNFQFPRPDGLEHHLGVMTIPAVQGEDVIHLPALVRYTEGEAVCAYYLQPDDSVTLYSQDHRRTGPGERRHLIDMSKGVSWVLWSLKRQLAGQ